MIFTEAGLEFRKRGIFLTMERAAFSTTFEMNGRLLTGRKFLKTKSSPGFFNRGMTAAVLQFSGTQPLRRERLTISVIEGANVQYITFDRVPSNHLDDSKPIVANIADFENVNYLLSKAELEQQRKDYIILVARVLIEYFPVLQQAADYIHD